ncbi:MAG: geranylgeranylglycerol-phosphate geranylgeranyltransferase [Bacteroidales bacterium]
MNFIKLIRWQNLIIIALTQYFTRLFLIEPFYTKQHITLQMNNADFFIFVLSVVLIAGAGYIINDIFDIQMDRINKPGKMIIDNLIPEKKAYLIYYIMNGIAAICGLYLGLKVGSLSLGLIFIILIAVFYFYSLKYKRSFLIGNFVIAFLAAFLLILVWLFEFFAIRKNGFVFTEGIQVYWIITYFVLAYSLFAFIITLIREFVKDIEDMEGDSKWGCTTLPVVIGVKRTKQIAAGFAFLGISIIVFFQIYLQKLNLGYFAGILMIMVQLPFAYLGIKILTAKDKEDFHFVSNLSKIIMVIGVLTMFAVYYSLQS